MTEQERRQIAKQLHEEGFSCSQAVLGALEDRTGLDRDTAMAVAGCFGAGCGSGELCGAVSGALMAIGMAEPHTVGADQEKKAAVRRLAQKCVRAFKNEYGYVNCRELIAAAKQRRCPEFIDYCTVLAGQIIEEIKEND